MAVNKCANGHFYDDEKFPECPHCKNNLPANGRRGLNDGKTVFGPSSPEIAGLGSPRRVRIETAAPKRPGDEKTVGVFQSQKGYDPVVGWLVCVEGREKGRDYRLHVGRNFIGRGLRSDVALPDDGQISREDHCSIVFEPKRGVFAIVRGAGEVSVNGRPIESSLTLHGDEEIELGASRFVFVPFCGEGRMW